MTTVSVSSFVCGRPAGRLRAVCGAEPGGLSCSGWVIVGPLLVRAAARAAWTVARVGWAVGGVFRQHGEHEVFEVGRDVAAQLGGRPGRSVQMAVDHFGGATVEGVGHRRGAGRARSRDCRDRCEGRLAVRVPVRGRGSWRFHNGSRLGGSGRCFVEYAGDAEVDDLHRLVAGAEQVAGFDVAVDHTGQMCCMQASGGLRADVTDVGDWTAAGGRSTFRCRTR